MGDFEKNNSTVQPDIFCSKTKSQEKTIEPEKGGKLYLLPA